MQPNRSTDAEIQTFATLTFTKISICFLLLRITIGRGYIRFLQALIAALVLSNVVLTVLWIVQCRPDPERAWNTEIPGTCFTKGQLERIIISQARTSSRLINPSLSNPGSQAYWSSSDINYLRFYAFRGPRHYLAKPPD